MGHSGDILGPCFSGVDVWKTMSTSITGSTVCRHHPCPVQTSQLSLSMRRWPGCRRAAQRCRNLSDCSGRQKVAQCITFYSGRHCCLSVTPKTSRPNQILPKKTQDDLSRPETPPEETTIMLTIPPQTKLLTCL